MTPSLYFLVYKTVNLKNGKFYIGAHTTSDKLDEYLGSGITLKKAIKKYGKKLFRREILAEAKNLEEMYEIEKLEIEKVLGDPLCYNLNNGGRGGFHFINDNKMNCGDKNVMRCDSDAKALNMARVKQTKDKNKKFYAKIAIRNLEKATLANVEIYKVNLYKYGSKRPPEELSRMRERSKEYWSKNKEKMRDKLSSYYSLVSPEGICYNTNRLGEFCKEHHLPFVSIWVSSNQNRKLSKGKAKGWLCKKI